MMMVVLIMVTTGDAGGGENGGDITNHTKSIISGKQVIKRNFTR